MFNKSYTMKPFIIGLFLFIAFPGHSFAQDNKKDFYKVGFRYYKTYDPSRQYVTNKDTTSRPLLIHHWYPCNRDNISTELTFKNYIDLIAIREDYAKPAEEIDANSINFINAYLGFAQRNYNIDSNITTKDVLDYPVKAIQNAPIINKSFPLVIYAPSNSKSSIQNHMICETLASNGFNVISVGSAGKMTLKRIDGKSSIEAQVLDMEFMLRYFTDSLQMKHTSLGLLGFSSGCTATALFQMRNNDVKAIFSLDGSNEYSSYLSLFGLKDFNLNNTSMAYGLLTNNIKGISIYPYYHSIVSTNKFMYKMPYLDHNGFVSFWDFFDKTSPRNDINTITKSYDIINEAVLKYFSTYLKPTADFNNKANDFQIYANEYIVKVTHDNSIVSSLLNTLLTNDIDTVISCMIKNRVLYQDKENEINILGRMLIDKYTSISIRLFLANLELHPNSWKAYYSLGVCYMQENNLSLAQDAVNKALELQPNNPDIIKLMEEVSE